MTAWTRAKKNLISWSLNDITADWLGFGGISAISIAVGRGVLTVVSRGAPDLSFGS